MNTSFLGYSMRKGLLNSLLAVITSSFVIWTIQPGYVLAQTAAKIVISELQTGTTASASEEFVELYNSEDSVIDLTDWRLEYKSATGASWSTKATLSGQIQPRGFYLVATAGYLDGANDQLASGLATSGGHVRMVKSGDGEILDLIGWGTADSPEGTAALAPAAGDSLKRKFNSDGDIIDADNNAADFEISSSPSPESTPAADEDDSDEDGDEPQPTYLPVEITELLPDPVEPQSDSLDEFVELYNPNAAAINLVGYIIKTGSNLQYSFVIPSVILEPGAYAVFYSKDGKILLANSGSQAQVFDPAGNPLSELVAYSDGQPGQSWALINDVWQWTNVVTPAESNQPSSGTGGDNEGLPSPPQSYLGVVVNELLVDPAAPLSDSNDEFVELYNPNSTSANLEDYQLQTGSSFKTKATLSDIVIAPGQYLVLYSRDFNVGLSNNGGAARLLDPNGQVVSDSQAYTNATSGDSWARFDSGWQWTGSPTPGAANVLSTSAAAAKKASKVKTATAKAKKAKKAAAAKKGKKAKDKATQAVTAPASIPTSPLSIGLVATAAGLALVYGAYEFRHDIRNKFHILKRYITHRFHSGP